MTDNKTWSGRFNEPVAELVKKYTGSIDFDKRLAKWDIQGSLAHAQMLQQAGVLSAYRPSKDLRMSTGRP